MKILTNSAYSILQEFPVGGIIHNMKGRTGTVIGTYNCKNIVKCPSCPTEHTCFRVQTTDRGEVSWCWSIFLKASPHTR